VLQLVNAEVKSRRPTPTVTMKVRKPRKAKAGEVASAPSEN
jgi:hypothetical protein